MDKHQLKCSPNYQRDGSINTNMLADYFPKNGSSKYPERLSRNSIAHGTYDYSTFTIYDFAKIAFLMEHTSSLKTILDSKE